ncbi:MAG: F-box protein [Chlamydiales bacterium]|nr:F-box protein [Chlamydiales bacterium]
MIALSTYLYQFFQCRPNPPISKLPNETLIKIFSYLPPNDVLHCRMVCRKWENVAADNQLWKEHAQQRLRENKLPVLKRVGVSWFTVFQYADSVRDLATSIIYNRQFCCQSQSRIERYDEEDGRRRWYNSLDSRQLDKWTSLIGPHNELFFNPPPVRYGNHTFFIRGSDVIVKSLNGEEKSLTGNGKPIFAMDVFDIYIFAYTAENFLIQWKYQTGEKIIINISEKMDLPNCRYTLLPNSYPQSNPLAFVNIKRNFDIDIDDGFVRIIQTLIPVNKLIQFDIKYPISDDTKVYVGHDPHIAFKHHKHENRYYYVTNDEVYSFYRDYHMKSKRWLIHYIQRKKVFDRSREQIIASCHHNGTLTLFTHRASNQEYREYLSKSFRRSSLAEPNSIVKAISCIAMQLFKISSIFFTGINVHFIDLKTGSLLCTRKINEIYESVFTINKLVFSYDEPDNKMVVRNLETGTQTDIDEFYSIEKDMTLPEESLQKVFKVIDKEKTELPSSKRSWGRSIH